MRAIVALHAKDVQKSKGEHSRKECPNNKRGQAFIGERGGRFTFRGRGQPSSNIGTIEDETIAAMGEEKADSIDNYMDSGCTENVLCPQNHFTSQKKVAPVKVGNIGKEPVIMTRRGTTNIVGTNGRGKPINFELKNSLISETLIDKNLISARRIGDAGHTIVIGRGAGGASKMR